MQRPCGGWKDGGKTNEAGSQKTKQSVAGSEVIGVRRCQTRQGFGDRVKNFAFYPKNRGKL